MGSERSNGTTLPERGNQKGQIWKTSLFLQSKLGGGECGFTNSAHSRASEGCAQVFCWTGTCADVFEGRACDQQNSVVLKYDSSVNLPPASTCLCGSVHKAHGVISHRWSWCIRLNLNTASSLLFFAEGKGCVLILGTPWLLSAGVTVGMLFQSNFFYLKVFMWADKALSLYPKVPCSTLVLLITLTCAGAATLDRKSVLSPILCLIFHGG